MIEVFKIIKAKKAT